jgi:hypothetical protein
MYLKQQKKDYSTMDWLRRDSKIPLLATGVAVLLCVAFIDYNTGPDYGFSAFYLLPILIFTWIGGKVAGICSGLEWIFYPAMITATPGRFTGTRRRNFFYLPFP